MTFERTQLSNGTVVISEAMEQVRSVSLGLWFNVGSRDEDEHQLGLAHFMEHMMFKGTPTRTSLDISLQFDALGAEFNAFTSKEYTCYYARFMQDKLETALEILADMVIASEFSSEAIETEREVVLEEIARSVDTPDDYVFEIFSEALYPQNPLGRPVLGSKDLVSTYQHAHCTAFHAHHYTSGNLCVVAAGNVNHEQLVNLVERYFTDMVQGTKNKRLLTSDKPASEIRVVTRDIEQAHIVYGFPALALGDERRYALGVLTTLLGGSMSARLFQEIREKRGLVYSIYASQALHQGQGHWLIYAGTRPENLQEVVVLIRQELATIAQKGLEEQEVKRTIDFMCGQTVLGFETTSSHMMRLGRTETLGIEHVSIDEVIERYRCVTAYNCTQLAQEIFAQKPTMALVSPLVASKAQDLLL